MSIKASKKMVKSLHSYRLENFPRIKDEVLIVALLTLILRVRGPFQTIFMWIV